jgi:hypothetical protein
MYAESPVFGVFLLVLLYRLELAPIGEQLFAHGNA